MIKLFTSAENNNFLRLWWAQLISQFGDRIHQLALVGLIAQRAPGSTLGLAKLMAFTIIPVFVIQPFAGVLVDRWDRRTTLFVCDFLRGLLVLLIPFVLIFRTSMVPIYMVVFLVFGFSRFYVPAKMSIIPDLVSQDHLLKANSLITTTGMIAAGLGAVLGAFIVEYYGPRNGFIIDGMTFFISSIIVFNIRMPWRLKIDKTRILEAGREIVGSIRKSVWMEIEEGFQYIIRHKEIRFVINMLFVLFAAAGAIYVVLIVFIQQSFQSVTKDLGILAVGLVAGLFSGVLLHGRWGRKFKWDKTIYFCLLLGGLMLIIFSVSVDRYSNIFVATFLSFVWGLTIGPIFVAANTIVHIVSDEEMRGKVFSALEIVIHFAFLISMLLSSVLSEFIEEVWILTGVGILCALIGLIGRLRVH